jgi:hypothetical protein
LESTNNLIIQAIAVYIACSVSRSGKSNAGKSYVIFGKANNTAINLSAIGTGALLLTVRMKWNGVAIQLPLQAMSTVMA